jgi:hypothetical protein
MSDNDDEFGTTNILWWQRWQVIAGLATLCIVLGILSWVLHAKSAERAAQIASLQERLKTGPLLPPSNIRSIKVTPERSGPGGAPQLTLRMTQPPDLIRLRIDVSFARQNIFQLQIDRKDQGRAGTIQNLLRDSNGELQLAINTSVLYPGTYHLKIEGLLNRGNPVAVGWVTVQVTQ